MRGRTSTTGSGHEYELLLTIKTSPITTGQPYWHPGAGAIVESPRRLADIAVVTAIKRKLPVLWRVLAAAAIMAAAIAASGAVHRSHGVPLFVGAVACGAVLGFWALGIWLVLAFGSFGFIIERAITGTLPHANGENAEAIAGLGAALITVAGMLAILLGIALGSLISLGARRLRDRHGWQ